MNSDRTIKELLDLFEIKNISQLGSDVILMFFDDISYKEIMKLCRVNKQFNIACNKESMWKKKVKNDYGIMKMYESTWKETARLLFESNMINLNANWINGKTYRELFEEGLESKNDKYFCDLYNNLGLLPIIFPDYVYDIDSAEEYVINNLIDAETDDEQEIALEQFNRDHRDILNDDDIFYLQLDSMTREFSVVAHAVSDIRRFYSRYGLARMVAQVTWRDRYEDTEEENIDIRDKIDKELEKLFDPMFYIISYSMRDIEYLSHTTDVW